MCELIMKHREARALRFGVTRRLWSPAEGGPQGRARKATLSSVAERKPLRRRERCLRGGCRDVRRGPAHSQPAHRTGHAYSSRPRAPPTRCGPSQHPRPTRRTAVPVAGGQDCSSLCPRAERSLKADPSPAPVTEMALDGGQVKTTVMLPTRDVLCLSWWLSGKESAYQCRRRGFKIPGSRRSTGEGNGSPLQYACLGNPVDGEAWRATVHGVAKQSDTTQQLYNNALSTHH